MKDRAGSTSEAESGAFSLRNLNEFEIDARARNRLFFAFFPAPRRFLAAPDHGGTAFQTHSKSLRPIMATVSDLTAKLDKLKRELNTWERSFEKQRGRPPGSSDVRECGVGTG
jgi:hypothetical protein